VTKIYEKRRLGHDYQAELEELIYVSIGRVIGNSASNSIVVGGAAADSYGGTRMFKGKIAMVSHYNRILSSQEIQQNYLAIKSRFGL
jgi:hypothetical protein